MSTVACPPRVAIVGGGPAGLMAAETLVAAGVAVDLYDAMGSVGRKFLVAGKGGLNLTHSEPRAAFQSRYGAREREVAVWLDRLDAEAIRTWARHHGIETFTGSSGRIFPLDLKAAPLLRAWHRRLREAGVHFHVRHRCVGLGADASLLFNNPDGELHVRADAVVFALGGASWPQLGSDGEWTRWSGFKAIPIVPLKPANCGFDVAWSPHFSTRFAGQPVKPAWLTLRDAFGNAEQVQGEFVVTGTGIEGSLVYALSARLRDAIARDGCAQVELDLAPGRDLSQLSGMLSKPRNGRSFSEFLRRNANISGVQAGLVHELIGRADCADPQLLARRLKAAPLTLVRPRPVAEAISTAGGVALESLDKNLMARTSPGIFFAGEMLDWEAPTGGYLLTACMASGKVAGQGVLAWLNTHAS